jgi:hypothetical protein
MVFAVSSYHQWPNIRKLFELPIQIRIAYNEKLIGNAPSSNKQNFVLFLISHVDDVLCTDFKFRANSSFLWHVQKDLT